jgi:hypothetical protein
MQLYLHNVNKYKYLCSPNTYILTQYIVATYINLKNPFCDYKLITNHSNK